MNIAIFTDSYKPQVNGVVTSIDLFKKEFERNGHRVVIFAPKVDGAKEEKEVFRFKSVTFTGYREYKIGVPYKILADPRVKKIKFDIVHIQSPFSMGAAGLGFAKYYKIPAIATFHTMYPDYMHYFIKSKHLQKLKIIKKIYGALSWSYMSWFHNRCKAVVAPSNTIKNELKKHGIRRVTVIPTGIEIQKKLSRQTVRKKHKIGNEKIILHVGRITKEKNIKFIIDSLKEMLSENTRMIITSDGPYKEELEDYVNKLGIGKKITFTGYISKEELRELYTASDVFVMASKTETQGIVLSEAAVNGLPVVVLNAPVISDFVRETKCGLVATENSFSKSVHSVLYGDERKYIMKKCKNIEKKYSIKKCADDMLKLYSEVRVQ